MKIYPLAIAILASSFVSHAFAISYDILSDKEAAELCPPVSSITYTSIDDHSGYVTGMLLGKKYTPIIGGFNKPFPKPYSVPENLLSSNIPGLQFDGAYHKPHDMLNYSGDLTCVYSYNHYTTNRTIIVGLHPFSPNTGYRVK